MGSGISNSINDIDDLELRTFQNSMETLEQGVKYIQKLTIKTQERRH